VFSNQHLVRIFSFQCNIDIDTVMILWCNTHQNVTTTTTTTATTTSTITNSNNNINNVFP
jgi:hypothetical protein